MDYNEIKPNVEMCCTSFNEVIESINLRLDNMNTYAEFGATYHNKDEIKPILSGSANLIEDRFHGIQIIVYDIVLFDTNGNVASSFTLPTKRIYYKNGEVDELFRNTLDPNLIRVLDFLKPLKDKMKNKDSYYLHIYNTVLNGDDFFMRFKLADDSESRKTFEMSNETFQGMIDYLVDEVMIHSKNDILLSIDLPDVNQYMRVNFRIVNIFNRKVVVGVLTNSFPESGIFVNDDEMSFIINEEFKSKLYTSISEVYALVPEFVRFTKATEIEVNVVTRRV